jgi:hypothetical protein
MPRRFNYTGRKSIAKADASFRVDGTGDSLRFEGTLRLADYKLDPDGLIFVEAYRGSTASWKRFAFGSVRSPVDPAGPLPEFLDPDGILFRVKITTPAGADGLGGGRLLAKADEIKPRVSGDQNDPAKSLLVTEVRALDGEAWRLVVEARSLPVLLVDPNVGGKEFVKHPAFRGLVAPAIVRSILVDYVLLDDDEPDPDDRDEPRNRWIAFAEKFAGLRCPFGDGTDDPRREWIDAVCGEFARRKNLVAEMIVGLGLGDPA